jgi:hypothetical protein
LRHQRLALQRGLLGLGPMPLEQVQQQSALAPSVALLARELEREPAVERLRQIQSARLVLPQWRLVA